MLILSKECEKTTINAKSGPLYTHTHTHTPSTSSIVTFQKIEKIFLSEIFSALSTDWEGRGKSRAETGCSTKLSLRSSF